MFKFFNYFSIYFIYFVIVILVLSLFLILCQHNPVFAVFSFVVTVIEIFLLLLIIGAEFIAILLLIIYIGVISILFLFVVIMYELHTVNLNITTIVLNPFLVVCCLKIYIINKICNTVLKTVFDKNIIFNIYNFNLDVYNFIALFNEHYVLLLMCGLLIFFAIIGSISITYVSIRVT